jgi:hypothetical protein
MNIKHLIAAAVAINALSTQYAVADTTWNWSYTGTNINASGTFTTTDTADASGFHQITAITGSRNGDAITGLYPTGMAIPGNEPFALDNLIRVGSQGQITVHGFGFATASGAHANPYFADFLSPPTYAEVFTTASSFSEAPISFSASAVPESESIVLALAGLGAIGFAASLRRHAG